MIASLPLEAVSFARSLLPRFLDYYQAALAAWHRTAQSQKVTLGVY
jgi:hypothetical protein